MTLRIIIACTALAAVAACAPTTETTTLAVPSTAPLSASEIPGVVAGGPYALTIYDGDFAGTTGTSTWNFSDNTVSGSFTTSDGQSGTFSNPVSFEGNQLCSGAGASKQCHLIYRYNGGFMEVTPAGEIHAVSLPT